MGVLVSAAVTVNGIKTVSDISRAIIKIAPVSAVVGLLVLIMIPPAKIFIMTVYTL
jgi:hypothetical protein